MASPSTILKAPKGIVLMSCAAALVAVGVGFMPAQVFSPNPADAPTFMGLMAGLCIGFGGALAIAVVTAPKELGATADAE